MYISIRFKLQLGVELFLLAGDLPVLLNLKKLRILIVSDNVSQTLGAKVRRQEGNSPDYMLRP